VHLFGANGIFGVGPFINDCDSNGACVPQNPPYAATYYTCPSPTTCTTTTATLAQQVQNPATLLVNPTTKAMTDTNGVIIELPAVPANGAPASIQPVGSLVFGIGTESNNSLGSATKMPVSGYPTQALVTATVNGTMYPNSYLDSGSDANIFPTSIPLCVPNGTVNAGFLCPNPSPVNLSAMMQGSTGAMAAADFSVANATQLFATPNVMFSNLGAANTDNTSVDFGLAFFYGRNVFTGFEVVGTPGTPPYFAY
jgi:hypothetical protein